MFSGHDSFQCRQLWLKKGFDFLKAGNSFTNDDAVLHLGVGKNMVASIRFWLRAFGISDHEDKVTEFGNLLLNDEDGLDPYLEDEGTLWLLHYRLVTSGVASTYSLIFNYLRKEKVEFQVIHFLNLVNRVSEGRNANTLNKNTLEADFNVFVKMYGKPGASKEIDEISAGLLVDLNLLQFQRRERNEFFSIPNLEREELPAAILLYAILSFGDFQSSIGFNGLHAQENAPGSVFALSRLGLQNKLEEIQKQFEGITFIDDAGIKELQFRKKVDPIQALRTYYGR